MILEIEDTFGNSLTCLHIRENNRHGSLELKEFTGDISIADIEFDDIFNTNEQKLRIALENIPSSNLNTEIISDNIVDDIISSRGGQGEIYDNEILDIFTNDYFANMLEEIKELVDEKMSKHLDDDNLTIL